MKIAVDFDGTIVEHRYPEIGREIPFAIDTLKRLRDRHYKLILWTAREGQLLEDAVNFCKERGLEFYAINAISPDEVVNDNHAARKLKEVDVFIDDRNLGGLPDWGLIYQMITRHLTYEQIYSEEYQNAYGESPKRGFFARLFGR